MFLALFSHRGNDEKAPPRHVNLLFEPAYTRALKTLLGALKLLHELISFRSDYLILYICYHYSNDIAITFIAYE